MPNTVPQWVEYIQTLHQREIELSLERVREVYRRLCPEGVPYKVITVAGTNGKGSTAELIASVYRSAGYAVGKYSSPHLVDFNERFDLQGSYVSDEALLRAMHRVEVAREQVALTFFEFGTLAAIELFVDANMQIAVMEVGLGGRLDAVNILAPEIALVTNISIDHTAWLGNTIDEIAGEKIAIARAGRPCLLGMSEPPQAIRDYCRELRIEPLRLGVDFAASLAADGGSWDWGSRSRNYDSLALPFAQAGQQLENAALAIACVVTLEEALPVAEDAIRAGIEAARLAGRCQVISDNPLRVFDVSHNVASVQRLADFVRSRRAQSQRQTGRVVAVCGMLGDKQIGKALMALDGLVDRWFFAGIDDARGITAAQTRAALLKETGGERSDYIERMSSLHEDPLAAYRAAEDELTTNDCLLVFGSFLLVSDIIRHTENTL